VEGFARGKAVAESMNVREEGAKRAAASSETLHIEL